VDTVFEILLIRWQSFLKGASAMAELFITFDKHILEIVLETTIKTIIAYYVTKQLVNFDKPK